MGGREARRVGDPGYKVIDLMLDLVKRSDGKAVVVGLDAIADRAKR